MKLISTLSVSAITLFHGLTLCSSGDRAYEFQECLKKHYTLEYCKENPLSWDLKLFFWNCLDKCKYDCMQSITNERKLMQLPVLQYYGKWPFIKFLGIQEPASVVFSLLNLCAHLHGYYRLKHEVSDNYQPLKKLNMNIALVQVNAWVWSSVFHSRDLPITEKLDYFSAAAVIVFACYNAAIRLISIFRNNKNYEHTLRYFCIFFLMCHCFYLSYWPFDYTYNIIIGAVLGSIQTLAWLFWSAKYLKKRSYAKYGLISSLGLFLAMSLELRDFPPIAGMFDAHSLWHLATFPLAFAWYHFIVEDCKFESFAKIL
jgi:post-GPI attachment to proteins factor 3